ncbi:hypothetical protein, partial [Nonomuraea sp. NPDC001023]|uniref:hypothetical protein n=1 Tax=Nonomuraea sp. NPDC001023 TaxID=3154770 RepID=UPI00331D6D9E
AADTGCTRPWRDRQGDLGRKVATVWGTTSVIRQDSDHRHGASWAAIARRGGFVSRSSGNLADREVGTVDPVIADQLGRAHPLARPLDDFC